MAIKIVTDFIRKYAKNNNEVSVARVTHAMRENGLTNLYICHKVSGGEIREKERERERELIYDIPISIIEQLGIFL